jgi:hypothetical protein
MDAMPDFAPRPLRCVDHIQWRYELIRPVVLIQHRPVAQRAAETPTHPDTVRHLSHRCRLHGTLGVFPEHTEVISPSRGKPLPDVVVEELARLKALYDGLG